MGQAYDCQCLDCSDTFTVSEGGGFTFIQWVCDGCGKTTSVPRYAPRISRREQKIPRPLQERTNFLTFGTLRIKLPFSWRIDKDRKAMPYNKIQRFTHEEIRSFLADRKSWWRSGGDQWDEFEIEMLRELIGPCRCGGRWIDPNDEKHRSSPRGSQPHAFHRCPRCKSKNFKYRMAISFD